MRVIDPRKVLRGFVALVVLVIPLLLILKIIQVSLEKASPTGPSNFVELVGFGIVRRIKDTSFWLIIAMLWVFTRIDDAWRLARGVRSNQLRLLRIVLTFSLGGCAIAAYMWGMFVAKETFFNRSFPVVQTIEGIAVCFVILMSAYYWARAFTLALLLGSRLRSPQDGSEKEAEAAYILISLGLIFAVAGVLLTIALNWIRNQLNGQSLAGSDGLWRIVGEIAVTSAPFVVLSLFSYCYFTLACGMRIIVQFADFPIKLAYRVEREGKLVETNK